MFSTHLQCLLKHSLWSSRCHVKHALSLQARPVWQQQGQQVRRLATNAAGDEEVRAFMQHFSLESIPRQTCQLSFSRSSGPGGQNVNKLNTKATLKLAHSDAAWIPNVIREYLRTTGSQYLTKTGDLVIQSQRNRTQELNKEDCFRKLADVIFDAAQGSVRGETSAETKQKVGRMIKRDNERRIEGKKFKSAKKSARRSKGFED